MWEPQPPQNAMRRDDDKDDKDDHRTENDLMINDDYELFVCLNVQLCFAIHAHDFWSTYVDTRCINICVIACN